MFCQSIYHPSHKMLIISLSFRLTRGTQRRFSPKCIENTFQAIQSTFRPLEIHSNRRFKIYICSVIPGQLESFRNYKGFSIIFPKIWDERRREPISLSIAFSNPKFFRFPFSAKNSLIWWVKCQKLNFKKSKGIYWISFENCSTWMERSSRNS